MEQIISILKTANFILGVMAIIIALGFLFIPKLFIRLGRTLDKSFSIEIIREKLEDKIIIDQWIMRHRIALAIISLVVSVVLLCQFFIYR